MWLQCDSAQEEAVRQASALEDTNTAAAALSGRTDTLTADCTSMRSRLDAIEGDKRLDQALEMGAAAAALVKRFEQLEEDLQGGIDELEETVVDLQEQVRLLRLAMIWCRAQCGSRAVACWQPCKLCGAETDKN